MGIKVAVYGSLRQGMGNHRLLEEGKAWYHGKDKLDGFIMYSLGGFPCVRSVFPEGNEIVVEVYEVDDETFARLDVLEGFPSFYDRKKVSTKYGDAWIYTIEREKSRPVVEGGDWVLYKTGVYNAL